MPTKLLRVHLNLQKNLNPFKTVSDQSESHPPKLSTPFEAEKAEKCYSSGCSVNGVERGARDHLIKRVKADL